MGVAAQFSKHLHKEVGAHAAWLPVANSFKLGDYGLVSDGVFNRIGNIREFRVNVDVVGSNPVKLDFKSEGTRQVSLVGEAEVNALPDSPIEASLMIEFSKSDSYYAKAAQASVQEIPNLREVAERLAKADGWTRKYRVVRATVTGHNCVIIPSKGGQRQLRAQGQRGRAQAGRRRGDRRGRHRLLRERRRPLDRRRDRRRRAAAVQAQVVG